jgi:hypothetical protein
MERAQEAGRTREVARRDAGFGTFLGWCLIPLLAALLLLTWSRVEAQRVRYDLAQMAVSERTWSERARRAEAEWQVLTSRAGLARAAALLDLRRPRLSQRWNDVP